MEGEDLRQRALRLRAHKQAHPCYDASEQVSALIDDCRIFWQATGEYETTEEDRAGGIYDKASYLLCANLLRHGGRVGLGVGAHLKQQAGSGIR